MIVQITVPDNCWNDLKEAYAEQYGWAPPMDKAELVAKVIKRDMRAVYIRDKVMKASMRAEHTARQQAEAQFPE